MASNPLLVTAAKAEAQMNFSIMFIYIATLESEIEWERENQIVVPIPRQSVQVAPQNLKTLIISPSELL